MYTGTITAVLGNKLRYHYYNFNNDIILYQQHYINVKNLYKELKYYTEK